MAWNPSKKKWERDPELPARNTLKWIGLTSEEKYDVNLQLGHSWGFQNVIRDVENAPNVAIEKYCGAFRMGFGKKITIDPVIRNALRKELMKRCREGIYIFASRNEKRKLRPVARMHDGAPTGKLVKESA